MNSSPLAILLIIAVSAAVFGGIVFFGLRDTTVTVPSSPVTTGTTVRIPDILNLPGFRSIRDQPARAPQPLPPSGADVVVERNELPSPILPGVPVPSQQPKFSTPIQIVPSRQTRPGFFSTPSPLPVPVPRPVSVFSQQPLQASGVASFSVLNVSPQLRDFRAQMVQEGVIANTEFVRINNNADMEQFILKLVEWQAIKASSTPEQIQDARDRITKAYDQIRPKSR